MKVVLIQDVKGVGKIDDIKEVSEGYARNFLFPKHLAVLASDKTLKELNDRKRKESKRAEEDLHEQQALATKLDGIEIVFKEKASEKNLLYSAVTPVKVVDKLKTMDIIIDKKQIVMEPIKTLGEFTVKIKFPHNLEAKIKIIVSI